MTVVLGTDLTSSVVEASTRIYHQRGHKAFGSDLATAVEAYTPTEAAPHFAEVAVVRVPAIPRVEAILHPNDDPALLAAGFAALVEAGWEVWVVIPATRMGIGHTALRGLGVVLQQWWCDGNGTVYFGTPEVP